MRTPKIIWTALLKATTSVPAVRGVTCDGYCTLEGLPTLPEFYIPEV